MNAPSVWQAIEHAKSHPELTAKAQARFADQARFLFLPHALELSASAAGSCSLELWAKLNGRFDLPDDYTSQAAKMDTGTLLGAWLAAQFAVGYEDLFASTVEVEVTGEHEGIPAHVEIVIDDATMDPETNGKWMVEIKTQFWGGAVTDQGRTKHSKLPHILQACKEAMIVGAPGFSVLNVYPAATKNKNPHYFIQDDFVTAEWVLDTQAEYRRLEAALGPVAPAADPPEAWRCNFCRYSACDKNKNPLNPKAQALPPAFAR
jgi:hypothetical protein